MHERQALKNVKISLINASRQNEAASPLQPSKFYFDKDEINTTGFIIYCFGRKKPYIGNGKVFTKVRKLCAFAQLIPQTPYPKRIRPACRVQRHRKIIQIHPVRYCLCLPRRCRRPEDRRKIRKTPA